jgi:peroxiredoxin
MVRMESTQILKTGQGAPSFELRGTDDKVHSLDDFEKSKLLLVIFMCNHCPYVRARIRDIMELQSKFQKVDLQIVGINSNDPNYEGEGIENMKKFAADHNLNFPYLIDEAQNVARAYGAVCTPDPYLFNTKRELIYHGRINDALQPETVPKVPLMEINVKRLLRGERIEKDFDPSLGCSIKWKR